MQTRRLPMFPLSTVLLPHALLPLHIFELRYQALLGDCLDNDLGFGIVLIERGSEVGGGDQRVRIGTEARILAASSIAEGRYVVVSQGSERIAVEEWLPDDPYPVALVSDHQAPAGAALDAVGLAEAESRVRSVRAMLSELEDVAPLPPDLDLGTEPVEILWRLCGEMPANTFDRQRLLELDDHLERLALLMSLAEERADDLSRMLAGG